MKEIVIKDIKRKTNLDRKILREAAILGYSALIKERSLDADILSEEEESFDYGVVKTDIPVTDTNTTDTIEKYFSKKLSEVFEQHKRLTEETIDKACRKLYTSFNFGSVDAGSEFKQSPTYVRRNTDLHNGIADVENFYSRSQVKKDDETDNGSVKSGIESL